MLISRSEKIEDDKPLDDEESTWLDDDEQLYNEIFRAMSEFSLSITLAVVTMIMLFFDCKFAVDGSNIDHKKERERLMKKNWLIGRQDNHYITHLMKVIRH